MTTSCPYKCPSCIDIEKQDRVKEAKTRRKNLKEHVCDYTGAYYSRYPEGIYQMYTRILICKNPIHGLGGKVKEEVISKEEL